MREHDLSRDLQRAIEKVMEDEPMSHFREQKPAENAEGRGSDGIEARQAEKASLKEDISTWFYTFMCLHIPVIGWIYLLRLAFGRKHPEKRSFARAYLIYKLVFLAVGLLIIAILAITALDMLDELLAYMEML